LDFWFEKRVEVVRLVAKLLQVDEGDGEWLWLWLWLLLSKAVDANLD